MADGAKPDVPTTDRQNEKKKKHRPFYEAVDAHARRRLIKKKVTSKDTPKKKLVEGNDFKRLQKKAKKLGSKYLFIPNEK